MTERDALVRRSLVGVAGLLTAWTLLTAVVPALRDRLVVVAPTTAVVVLGALLAHRGRFRDGVSVAGLGGGALLFAALATTGGHASRIVAFVPLSGLFAVAWSGPRAGVVTVAIVTVLSAVLPTGLPTDSDLDRAVTLCVAMIIGASFAGPLVSGLRAVTAEAAARAAEAELEAGRALVDDASRDQFLTSVSHELRTPLDTVRGYAELLLEDEADPVRAVDLGRIRSAAKQLGALVDDLIEMAGTDGELSVDCGPVELRGVVASVVGTVSPLVEANHNRLVVEPGPPVTVWADGRRVHQVLLNLLSNAAKYTERGTVAVRVVSAGDGVRVEVTDTGVGIPKDRMAEMFRPFVQLHEGTQRRPGVGLGLALSQRLADRMGGRITARSEEGVGSTFTLWLRSAAP